MSVKTPFSRTLAACFALCLFAFGAVAQTDISRPRQVAQVTQPDGSQRLETDVFLVSEATTSARPDAELVKPRLIAPRLFEFRQMMMSAIDTRIGAPYVYGTEGPRVFDCSGFVWSVFQSAGVNFERGSARDFWATFNHVSEDEKYKFGTLVFFNNLKHVGIVADENGFYHASTSQGVTYSSFSGYWGSRITGFRRVPLPASTLAD
ncbi:MAG TPA: C40 family peptidase [Pyrinomonadaceae bacterium]|jgi:peptidoglycan endopeptidase LytE|nr:C40 family peptidase [Pyrinomonadaceae bacterium]